MKIFITGATGYIGSSLANKLISSGNIVHALVRDVSAAQKLLHATTKLFEGDINNINSIRAAMEGCDVVFHLAAYAKLWSRDNSVFYKTNVDGTRNVLDTAMLVGVRKVIYTSSCGVLGNSSKFPLSENDPRLSSFNHDYDISKYLCETMIQEYIVKGLNCVIVSPSRVYGPGPASTSNAITKLIERCINGEVVVVPSPKSTVANYAFIDDVVKGHILAMLFGVEGERYILGGENLTYHEVLRAVGEHINVKRVVYVPPSVLKGIGYLNLLKYRITGTEPVLTPQVVGRICNNAALDCSKAISRLDYKITPFADGVSATIARLKKATHEN
jgi:nucleoside-diphosphate-sugar epimerase